MFPWRIRTIAQTVRNGGVIGYPTEAVWGLGCDPFNPDAVNRILALKSRSPDKGLILLAAHIEQFDFLLDDIPKLWLDRMASTWPGPNTWLVPHRNRLPRWLTGAHDSIALRVTDHPLAEQLCACCGPLVSTSANPSGRPAARSRLHLERYFHGQLDGILNGPLGSRKRPSRIRDISSGEVIRL